MTTPAYITSTVDDATLQRVNAAVLLSGPPDIYINYDTASVDLQADLATLVAKNGGTLPLKNEQLMDVVLTSDGTPFRQKYGSLFQVNNNRYTGSGLDAATAASVQSLVSGEGIVRVIGQSAVPIVHTGTTTATLLATVPVPANVMGPNGALRFTVWWSMTNNANSKNVNLRWGNGNVTIWSAGVSSWPAAGAQVMVCNRGNTGSQIASGTGTTASFGQLPGFVTSSEDTTIDQRMQITCTLANAADIVTIERYLVEVLR